MSSEVLYVFGLCLLAFITGRLMVSKKEASEQLSRPLFGILALFCINYVALYQHWFLAGLTLLIAYFLGFAGKDSLKPLWRNWFKPKARKKVGRWERDTNAKHEDDHSDVGIGS